MLAQQLVNGLMLGGAYALVAIGYTLIFGVLNLLHLAHGEVFMVGAYVGLTLALAGFPPWATLGGAMLAAAVLGVLVERVAFRPVRQRGSHVTPLMTTIAVGLILQHCRGEDLRRRAGGVPGALRVGGASRWGR